MCVRVCVFLFGLRPSFESSLMKKRHTGIIQASSSSQAHAVNANKTPFH